MIIFILALLAIICMPQIVAFCIAFRDAYREAYRAARDAAATTTDDDDSERGE